MDTLLGGICHLLISEFPFNVFCKKNGKLIVASTSFNFPLYKLFYVSVLRKMQRSDVRNALTKPQNMTLGIRKPFSYQLATGCLWRIKRYRETLKLYKAYKFGIHVYTVAQPAFPLWWCRATFLSLKLMDDFEYNGKCFLYITIAEILGNFRKSQEI